MRTELITQRDDLVIRRHTLDPGEATPWHTDACRRLTVVVRGDEIRIEFRPTGEPVAVPVHPGLADWDQPKPRVHRAVNAAPRGSKKVVTFFLDSPGIDPQPERP